MSAGSQIQKATIMTIQSTELMRNGSGEMTLNANSPAESRAKTLTSIIMSLISGFLMK
jgi:hypothetical protein